MYSVQPWMRLKVNADTFVLPDTDGTVYFRNNIGSFTMEGTAIQSWVEKLLPVFDGQQSLEHLTDGLPAPYAERIYQIADTLYQNGFVRDVSQEQKHSLAESLLQYYGPQIAFIDNLLGSGAHRFEVYRNSNVLLVGSGPSLVSLTHSLLESGLQAVNLVITDKEATPVSRFASILAEYQALDDQTAIHDWSNQVTNSRSWNDIVKSCDSVMYISEIGNLSELLELEAACRAQNRLFIPGIFVGKVGIAGPITTSDSTFSTDAIPGVNSLSFADSPQSTNSQNPNALSFTKSSNVVNTPESPPSAFTAAWRRLHRPALEQDLGISGLTETAGAMLANVIAFELFKSVTGLNGGEANTRLYTLNVETLEGSWHGFIPTVTDVVKQETSQIKHLLAWMDTRISEPTISDLLSYFAQLTDTTAGIFHVWDEGSLRQLPIARCRVQVVDPLSPGPAELLPEVVCAGLSHEEARREAGLVGIEAYAKQLWEGARPQETPGHVHHSERVPDSGSVADGRRKDDSVREADGRRKDDSVRKADDGRKADGGRRADDRSTRPATGVGAGSTRIEALGRGLCNALTARLHASLQTQPARLTEIRLGEVKDTKCRDYLQALRSVGVEPIIGRSKDVLSFPMLWVGVKDRFIGTVGFSLGMALQRALEYTLLCQDLEPGATLIGKGAVDKSVDGVGTLQDGVDRPRDDDGVHDRRWAMVKSPEVVNHENEEKLDVESWDGYTKHEVITALEALAQLGIGVTMIDLGVEPFLTEVLAGVVSVSLREEGSQ